LQKGIIDSKTARKSIANKHKRKEQMSGAEGTSAYPDLPHVGVFTIQSDYSKLSACYPIPQISELRDSSRLCHSSLQDFLGRWSVGPTDDLGDEQSKAAGRF
jgi:hypothetical protein